MDFCNQYKKTFVATTAARNFRLHFLSFSKVKKCYWSSFNR